MSENKTKKIPVLDLKPTGDAKGGRHGHHGGHHHLSAGRARAGSRQLGTGRQILAVIPRSAARRVNCAVRPADIINFSGTRSEQKIKHPFVMGPCIFVLLVSLGSYLHLFRLGRSGERGTHRPVPPAQ